MCVRFIKQHGSGVHIAGFLLERHGFGLAGLMVLKGNVFGLFLPFLHQMVLKGGAIMTYGLQMSSVPSVDSAVGALDHVGSSTFQYFSPCASCPLNRACALFVVKELDLFLDFENAYIFGSVGFVEVFFLFFLKFNESLPDLMYIDSFGWS